MAENKTPKGRPQNKFRQVLLIEGKPAPLYVDYPRTKVSVIVDGETYRLGYMTNVIIDLLKKIPGAEVKTEIVNSTKTVGLKTVRGLHIRKSDANTTIEVSAHTKEALTAKIVAVTAEMEECGIKATQRCNWICVTDLAHPEPDDLPEGEYLGTVPMPEHTKDPEYDKRNQVKLEEHQKSVREAKEKHTELTAASERVPKKKTEPGRHGPGKPPKKVGDNTQAMKERIANLRELAVKKGLTGVMPNTPPTDTDMHGD